MQAACIIQHPVKFSIITPSFKQLDWLRTCIASVADQLDGIDNPEFEIEHIIQDAGSPGIREFALEHGAALYIEGKLSQESDPTVAARDPRIAMTIWSERDDGMYDAINRGLRRASGDIAAWLNCDEQYLPNALRLACQEMTANPDAEVLIGGAVITESDGSYRCHRPGVVQGYRALYRRTLTMQSCSIFFRRELFGRGFALDPSWKAAGDKEWILRMLANHVRIKGSDNYHAVYFETGENLSSMSELNRMEEERMIHTHPQIHPAACRTAWLWHALRVVLRFRLHPPAPHYRIYGHDDPSERREMTIAHPTLRWRRGSPATV